MNESKIPRCSKYVVVTGGVLSGVGKGVIASSTGVILKARGLRVTHIKIDPYINIDAGCMSPFEHGEVFVLDDGGEVDLDLGNYERFSDLRLTRANNLTTGKVYQKVIERERRGDFLGKTVQVVPHITNEIQDWIETVAQVPTMVDLDDAPPDVCIIELGGTVGDIESMPFVEALRQFQFRVGKENFCLMHVSLVPTVGGGEQKSKPTQHSVKELRALGLFPDLLICRSTDQLDQAIKTKLAMFCHVTDEHVLSVYNVANLFYVPDLLEQQRTSEFLIDRLGLQGCPELAERYSLSPWRALSKKIDRLSDEVHIALVGKYTGTHDCYHSIIKALTHAAAAVNYKVIIEDVESSFLEHDMKQEDPAKYHEAWRRLCLCQGVIVPGGFGGRGFEGKILAAQWARTSNIPYLGVCLGMQVAVIEFARNVLGLEHGNTTEVDPDTEDPIVIDMPEISQTHLGGTMRLGSRITILKDPESMAARLYGAERVEERHRHRWEVNPDYIQALEEKGLKFVGHDEELVRMEVIELKGHPYFLGAQYHPEYKTRPQKPSPLFFGLLLAATGQLEGFLENGELEQ